METIEKLQEQVTSEIDADELKSHLDNDDRDFTINNVRFIHTDDIDKIQQEELLSDLYCLGCFNADFLSRHIGLDPDEIKAIQKAKAFEAVGKIAAKHIEAIQKEYSSIDGYGHHFNNYDFSEIEWNSYHVFDERN